MGSTGGAEGVVTVVGPPALGLIEGPVGGGKPGPKVRGAGSMAGGVMGPAGSGGMSGSGRRVSDGSGRAPDGLRDMVEKPGGVVPEAGVTLPEGRPPEGKPPEGRPPEGRPPEGTAEAPGPGTPETAPALTGRGGGGGATVLGVVQPVRAMLAQATSPNPARRILRMRASPPWEPLPGRNLPGGRYVL